MFLRYLKKRELYDAKVGINSFTCAAILQRSHRPPKNLAIITHAGGPAVILTDILSASGVELPDLDEIHRIKLGALLYPGASTKNPIDILATGTADQLNNTLDYCENEIDEIEGIIVIFGSPGLGSVDKAFQVIHEKSRTSKKPVYAILPSTVNVHDEIQKFITQGNLAFNDEYQFGTCLAKILASDQHKISTSLPSKTSNGKIQALIDKFPNGYLNPSQTYELLTNAQIKMAKQVLVKTESDLLKLARELCYPVVQKIVGPLHKSDQKGVITKVLNITELTYNFRKLMQQKGVKAVMIQEMIRGKEVFIGSKREKGFPPLILCGAGGIYVETLNDISTDLTPINKEDAKNMVDQLKINSILEGTRGETRCNLEDFYQSIENISDLLIAAPQIAELDINPLMISETDIIAVDARIRIQK